MAGSIPGSDLAERRPGLERPAPFHAVRWKVLRRAARARLAPFGAGVMLLAVLGALAAPLVAPYDPLAQNLGNTLARPDRAHLLGTDNVGRDVLSRVIWGTRVSLLAGLVSVALAVLAGSLLGLGAGYCGTRLRRCGASPRRIRLARRGSARGAERDQPDHRAGVAERGLCHPRRSLALVPGARHPAAAGVLGQHDQRRPRIPAAGALDRLRPGRRALRDRGGIELRRRRSAGRARSPDERVREGAGRASAQGRRRAAAVR